MPPILAVENLVKKYGDFEAVKGISFSVEEGEAFGLLDLLRERLPVEEFSSMRRSK